MCHITSGILLFLTGLWLVKYLPESLEDSNRRRFTVRACVEAFVDQVDMIAAEHSTPAVITCLSTLEGEIRIHIQLFAINFHARPDVLAVHSLYDGRIQHFAGR